MPLHITALLIMCYLSLSYESNVKLSYFSDHDHWTLVQPNPPYPCSVTPPKSDWIYQPTTGHLLQYDPSYDDKGCIIQCRRSHITYTRNFIGVPYESIHSVNLYNCSEAKESDRYQFSDLNKIT